MGYSEVSTQADEVYGSIELISKSHLDANTCGPKSLSKLREVNVRAFDCFNEEEWEHLNTFRPLAILPSIRKVSLASINASRRLKPFAWTDTNRTLGIEDLQFHQSAILHYKISEILHGLTNLKRFTHNYSMILNEIRDRFMEARRPATSLPHSVLTSAQRSNLWSLRPQHLSHAGATMAQMPLEMTSLEIPSKNSR